MRSALFGTFVLTAITIINFAQPLRNFQFHRSLTDSPPPAIHADSPYSIKSNTQVLQEQLESMDSINPAQISDSFSLAELSSDSVKLTGADTSRKNQKPVADTFAFKTSKDSLSSPVVYHADDSMILDVPGKKLMLYGKKSTVDYDDNKLTAPYIEYNSSTSLVTAYLKKDSTGENIIYPEFTQSDFNSKSDTIVFNMKTGKGLTKGTYTQQGEMYVYGETIKKVNESVFYAHKARFTTCDLDTPHFAFVANRIKFISKKMAYSGPVHPEFEGVPIPVYLPFGIYPLQQGRHSGFIAPSFTANAQQGLALEGLGYYKVVNQTWDVMARGTIYSYGGWTATVSPRYFKRYRYQGGLSYTYQNFKTNFKGDPDYKKNRTMALTWNHNADTKARPGVTFGANVNLTSSKFNEQVPNSALRNITNQMTSTITYGKVWKDKPYNVSVTASENQNAALRVFNVNFPNVNFNLNTIYPFRKKEAAGELKWYENIGVALTTRAINQSSFYDTAGNIGNQLAKRYQWSADHNIPVTLALPSLGPIQLSPGMGYNERWFQSKQILRWNSTDQKLDTSIQKGFYTTREMSFSLGATTRIFGMFGFRKGSKVQAIRHEIRPTISFSYKPDFTSRYYYRVQVDTFGTVRNASFYEGNINTPFSPGKFAGLNFELDNILGMKVRNKKDTGEAALKKVSLLDGLSMRGSYNFLVDSFKLSPISFNARSNIQNKVNITASALLDPYSYDTLGRKRKTYAWNNGKFNLGPVTSASVSLSSSFRGGENKVSNQTSIPTTDELYQAGMTMDEYQREAAYIQNNPGEFADFSIPWSVDLSYSMRLNRTYDRTRKGFRSNLSQDVNWNASMNLTPRWKLGMTGFYNIKTKELGTITMYLTRELHCWQISINISRSTSYKFFTINISPKSPILRDLKVNRTRYFYDL